MLRKQSKSCGGKIFNKIFRTLFAFFDKEFNKPFKGWGSGIQLKYVLIIEIRVCYIIVLPNPLIS